MIHSIKGIRSFVVGFLQREGLALPSDEFADEPVGYAVVDDGRWIVHCTNPNCRGASMVDREDLRQFCLSCLNEHVGRRWIKVEMPATWSQVEDSLDHRPHWEQYWNDV